MSLPEENLLYSCCWLLQPRHKGISALKASDFHYSAFGGSISQERRLRNIWIILSHPLRMSSLATLSFSIQLFEGVRSVTPCVNGVSLIEIVSGFEHERGFSPAGGYGPLIPEWFNCGPLDKYFLADFESDSYFVSLQGIYLLGCDCGEVACWPLVAHIATSVHTVKWSHFRQPFREGWSYDDLGPFVFDLQEYGNTVIALRDEFALHIA